MGEISTPSLILPRRGGENVVGGGFEVNCITAAMSEAPKEASTRYSSSDDRGEEMRGKLFAGCFSQ